MVAAAVADGVEEEAGGDPAAGAPASARLRARRAARHALPRDALQAQEGGPRGHQGGGEAAIHSCNQFITSKLVILNRKGRYF